ncbi:MAG: TRAP transporter small permease subunit [Treponema sp.]|jgi:TRAP-type C4-dicarboxylate transport system permease small subunit|nr:TRAP transporter small permease subunit [Treponema sp.]
MRKILETIDRISTAIAIILFVLMVLILLLNIVLRQFSSGISWYMESAQFLNIWSVFIAVLGLCATNDHLHIDAIEGVLKGTPKRIIRLVITLFTVGFFIILGYSFVLLASRSRNTISTMPALKMAYIYWPIPVLCFLSALSCTLHAIWDFMSFGKGEKLQLLAGGETEK